MDIKEFYYVKCTNMKINGLEKCGWLNKWKFTDLHPKIQEMLLNHLDSDATIRTTCGVCKQEIIFHVRDLL